MSLDAELLGRFARKYIWWKKPEDALARPERIVAQVMNIGDLAMFNLSFTRLVRRISARF